QFRWGALFGGAEAAPSQAVAPSPDPPPSSVAQVGDSPYQRVPPGAPVPRLDPPLPPSAAVGTTDRPAPGDLVNVGHKQAGPDLDIRVPLQPSTVPQPAPPPAPLTQNIEPPKPA